MSIVKSHRFPVSIRWQEGRLTHASVAGKPDLDVATPPEFKGGIVGVWSPEDLLVAASASCYAVTLLAVAERISLVLDALEVNGTGHVERGEDGLFGFIAIQLRVRIEVDAGELETARKAARETERLCMITRALDAPVHVEVEVEPTRMGAESVFLAVLDNVA